MKNDFKNFKITIYGWKWSVEFVDPTEIEGFTALCYHNEFKIKIRNNLPKHSARLRFIHEITHAILGCQGRIFQKRYSEEDLCEIVSYNLDEIKRLVEVFDKTQAGGKKHE